MELITAKYVLPMEGEAIEDGAIATELGKICAVGKADELKKSNQLASIQENPNSVLMPGLINAHTHLDLSGAFNIGQHGASNSPDYIEWLLTILNHRHKSSIREIIIAIQGAINNLISAGTTCVGDMTCFEGIFNIIEEMGIRAVVFPEIYAGAGEEAQDRFETAMAIVDKYLDKDSDLVKVGLGPFAPYLLSKNLLSIISQHAKNSGVPIQIHAAESFTEMEFFYDSKGSITTTLFPAIGWTDELPPPHHKTPIQYLGEIGFLEASPAIVGGLHLGIRDFTTIARNMCRAIYCPRTNHFLGHGMFPFGKLREHGIPIGIGTDTLNGPAGFNLWDEMRFVAETAITPTPTARELLHMATIGGARVLSVENITGSLAPGKAADYILIDMPECPTPQLIYDAVIRHTRLTNVRKAAVAGEILKVC
jgi:cytosine/adenosine deaminase-related metal-dependent hydrolase